MTSTGRADQWLQGGTLKRDVCWFIIPYKHITPMNTVVICSYICHKPWCGCWNAPPWFFRWPVELRHALPAATRVATRVACAELQGSCNGHLAKNILKTSKTHHGLCYPHILNNPYIAGDSPHTTGLYCGIYRDIVIKCY